MYQANEHSGPVVYSTEQRRAPIADRQSMSIKVIAYSSAFIIFALFLIITATDLILARNHYQDNEVNTPRDLAENARAIEAQLEVYRQIVQHIAAQPDTRDLLENRDKNGPGERIRSMRQFLPQATGFSLLTPDSRVLGELSGQSLTPQCLTDMAKINRNEAINTPAVHQESSGIAHFDLTSPILNDNGDRLGMLVISINVDSLKSLLKVKADNRESLTLLDGYGNNITQTGSISDVSNSHQSDVSLAGTSWKLRLLAPANGPLQSFLSLTIFNISAILLTVGVIAFLVQFIMRSMNRDFDQVKSILGGLANGESIQEVLPTPQLRETAEVFPAITQIQRIIDKKQQLLEHQELSDKLTGLSNRRQFNIEFARAYDFARRGTPVCVVLMRLSGQDNLTSNQFSQVVKILSCTLSEHSRRIDHAARLDANQFALLMFGASPAGITPCLERISRSFRKHQTDHPAIPNDRICSVNMGYTRIHAHRDGNAAQVLKRAEAALAEAEQSADCHITSA